MKALIMSMGLFVMTMGVAIGLSYYISFEYLRYHSQFILKQALQETIYQLSQTDIDLRKDRVMNAFIDNFQLRTLKGVSYTINLMGFKADPLFLRIELDYMSESSMSIKHTLEETMIEVNNE
jgi:hypothetical protein